MVHRCPLVLLLVASGLATGCDGTRTGRLPAAAAAGRAHELKHSRKAVLPAWCGASVASSKPSIRSTP